MVQTPGGGSLKLRTSAVANDMGYTVANINDKLLLPRRTHLRIGQALLRVCVNGGTRAGAPGTAVPPLPPHADSMGAVASVRHCDQIRGMGGR